jgi:zinc protease
MRGGAQGVRDRLSKATVRGLVAGGALAACGLFPPSGLLAQVTTHPREMDLPTPGFERPDPAVLRLELDDGLVAYVARDDRAPLVTFTAFIAGGSAHGDPGVMAALGAALRRGPDTMAPGAFREALDRMAAVYSVQVGREETEVVLEVGAEDAWEALEVFAESLRSPALEAATQGGGSPAPRTSSAGGIDYDGSLAGAVTLFENALYGDHPLGLRTGEASPGPEAIRAAHDRYVVPGNVTLAVAGDFDPGEARRRVAEAFDGWSGPDRPDPVSFSDVETSAPRTVVTAEADKLQGWVVIGHELPPVPLEDEAALQVMDYVLGAYHLDSRLFRESRELRGLTNDNSSFLEPGVRGPGSYTVRTYGRPEAVRLLVDVTFRELERIRESRPTEDEIFVAKGALVDGLWATRYATGLDATRSYAREWLRHGDHDRSESYPERIGEVTAQEIQEAARRYIHPERMIVSVVGPLDAIREAEPIEDEPSLASWGRVREAGAEAGAGGGS